jgi:ABC-type transport system involved in cytochrome bd biosynthesis fused ATPase/permease subunit
MVARALLSEPAVLLLDEPTANLDHEAEQALLTTLTRQARERLVLVVAHRPAIIAAAERVLVIKEGRLIYHVQ